MIMAKRKESLPTTRTGQLAMAQMWSPVIIPRASAWGISSAQLDTFDNLISAAAAALAKTQDKSACTHVDIVICQQASKALVAMMRFLKNNFFNCPPRTPEELAMLGLTPNNLPSPVPTPENQATGKTRPLGDHLVEFTLEIIGDMVQDTAASDYGFRVYAAVEDPNAAPGTMGKYGPYLITEPLVGNEFSFSFFTKRKREVFDYIATDRGKKAWFCCRLEREKGGQEGKGPWGPLVSTIIP
jgi:hypothetical protein